MRRSALGLVAVALLLGAPLGGAGKPRGLRAPRYEEAPRLDGVPKEWEGQTRALDQKVQGSADEADLSARVLLGYDAQAFYLGADVRDDKLVGGGDRLELVLGIPGGTLHRVLFYPGEPGKSAGAVKSENGQPISGAKVVEAPTDGGYTLEAKLPWSSIPKSATVRVGYRGAVLVHDADASRTVETVMGTSSARRYDDLPPLSLEPEIALGSGLLRERRLTQAPRYNLMADVVGDKLHERVMVYGSFLVVLGPGYRDGSQYFYRDLAVDADGGELPALKLEDLTGDGKAELSLKKRIAGGNGKGAYTVEVLELLSYHGGGEVPQRIFAHELAVEIGGGSVRNELSVQGSGARTVLVVSAGSARGIAEHGSLQRAGDDEIEPLLLPWGPTAKRSYAFKDGRFRVVREEATKDGATPSPPPPRPAPSGKTPTEVITRVHQNAPDLDAVYARYKSERGAEGSARFDVRGDVAEDERVERIIVHGRDLLVMGEGFRGGRAFSAVTLDTFARGEDIDAVETREATGGGKKELIVRGRVRSPLPEDVGTGEMERSVVLVYAVLGHNVERVLAAEVGRRIGDRRIEASIQFVTAGDHSVELRPGRAVGYDEGSYPWRQKTSASDGFEPLLLPWGGIERVRLRFDGKTFVRVDS